MAKDTGDTQEKGTDEKPEFSPEQQKFLDKLIGTARTSGREKGKADAKAEQDQSAADAERKELAASAEFEKLAQMHADRVTELEPYETEAKAYRELITGMLKDKVKALGDVAKTAVKALPESLSDLDKLNWLNQNQELFATEGPAVRVGTPARRKKPSPQSGDKGRESHRRLRL